MSLYNYLVKSNAPLQEIRSSFDREEIESLYNHLSMIGWRQYLGFVQEHLADIVAYIGQSPSGRRQKKWSNRPDIQLIRFAALQPSETTAQVLNDLEPIVGIVDRGSYRSFYEAAARALAQPYASVSFLDFPFEGWDNPFLSNPDQNPFA